jgi:Pyrimidine dimer DNA glycosylase
VQTFLPYPDFERSARVLDVKRLGKQRVECLQVVRGLTVADYGWRHHPAVKMWRGHLEALGRYTLVCCEVWTAAGRADTCATTVVADLAAAGTTTIRSEAELVAAGAMPWWLGDADFHRSHQSALLRKDPAHYRPLFPAVPDDLPYVWPAPPEEPDGGR